MSYSHPPASQRLPARYQRWNSDGIEVAALLRLARASAPDLSDARTSGRFLMRFRAHAARRTLAGAWLLTLARVRPVLFAVGVASVALLLLKPTLLSQDVLSYRIKAVPGADVRRVMARDESVDLPFSDGSLLRLEPRTRVSIAETRAHGARVHLDEGEIAFNLPPHVPPGDWNVDAGAFQLRSNDALFSVRWHDVEGALRVEVLRGTVIVVGAGQRVELGAGESFSYGWERWSARPLERAEGAPTADFGGVAGPREAWLRSSELAAKVR